MVILFFVALFLAWPTAGLSIAAYVAILIISAVLKAKVRMHHANQVGALQDLENGVALTPPSWVLDQDKIELFQHALIKIVPRKGVPTSYIAVTLKTKDAFEILLAFAGQMEKRGSSFTEQQAGAAELLEKMWIRLDEGNKQKFKVLSI